MTVEQATAELRHLRELADGGETPSNFKERLSALYWAVCRKTLRKCNCKDVIPDALAEIYFKLKTTTDNDMATTARLVNGVVLQHKGSHYTNANITDDVARDFLAEYPHRKDWFATLPPEEAAEAAEPAVEATKEADKPTAPAKKKNAKKGK